MKITKIYNEIITIFNDETQQWDTLYEDSFDYFGDDLYLFNEPEASDPILCIHGSEDLTAGMECCLHSRYFGAYDSSWNVLPLYIPGNTGGFGGTNFCGSDQTLVKLTHTGGINQDSALNQECCVDNNIKHWAPFNYSEYYQWSNAVPLCNNVDYPGECKKTGLTGSEDWGLDTIVLGFTCTNDIDIDFNPWCDEYVEQIPGGQTLTIANRFQGNRAVETAWLCEAEALGARVKACLGHWNGGSSGDYPIECSCEGTLWGVEESGMDYLDGCDSYNNVPELGGNQQFSWCVSNGGFCSTKASDTSEAYNNPGEIWETYCDSDSKNYNGTYELSSCGAQTYCQCGQLNECGVCSNPSFGDPDPCCGQFSDMCGVCNGLTEFADIDTGPGYFGDGTSQNYEYVNIIRYAYNFGMGSPGVQDYCQTAQNEAEQWVNHFCYCDCEGNIPQPITCYDTTIGGDYLEDKEITFYACDNDECSDFGSQFSGDVVDSYDQGCVDMGACNYHVGYEQDCNGYAFDEQGYGDEEGWDSCCVYPAEYCVNDGSHYDATGAGPEAGSNRLCDIQLLDDGSSGATDNATYCPICDCGTFNCYCDEFNNHCINGEEGCNYPCSCDCPPQCGAGYPDYADYNSANALIENYGEGEVPVLQMDLNWLTNPPGTCQDGSFCMMYAGPAGDIDISMTDLGAATGYSLIGCADEVSLNFAENMPLYQSLTPIENEMPLQSCVYCPGSCTEPGPNSPTWYDPDGCRDECPAGYVFYWNEHALLNNNTSTAAMVTDDSYEADGNFDLQGQSIHLEDGGTGLEQGACYCVSDLEFLQDVSYMIPGWSHTGNDLFNGAVTINSLGGEQKWDEWGRLYEFTTGGAQCSGDNPDNCRDDYLQLGGAGVDNQFKWIPRTINKVTHLQNLDLSYNYIQDFNFDGSQSDPRNAFPKELENLENVQYIDLSHNYLKAINEDYNYGHGIYLSQTPYGICRIAEYRGFPTFDDPWLKLYGNRICPTVESEFSMETSYPECLSPASDNPEYEKLNDNAWPDHQSWCEWIWDNLGYADIPCYEGYNEFAQDIENADGSLNCDIIGCTLPQADNYWPAATMQCPNCCHFDKFFHFPWGDLEITEFSGGSYGGNMTLIQMVQALHADQYGYKYNAWGELDVAGTPVNVTPWDDECLIVSDSNGLGTYMNNYQIGQCTYVFTNDPSEGGVLSEYIDGNEILNHWDGIWLRDCGYLGDGQCVTAGFDPDGQPIPCQGDARPLEFLNRVEFESYTAIDPGAFRNYWWSWFPPSGMDISMDGIDWLEDYDINNDGQLTGGTGGDSDLWRQIGRNDIADMIDSGFEGMPLPESAPEDVELWEQAPAMVSMSYSQKFRSEAQAGFTPYGDEEGSMGQLTRNGQWTCSDGGDATICYEDIYACGRAPNWVTDCSACGNGGDCEPVTLDTSAVGYHKIVNDNILVIPYFGYGNSELIAGSNIYTASLSSSNHPYYYNVIDDVPTSPKANTQFSVAFGHYAGSGSDTKGDTVKGTSEVIYKQYASMLLDDLQIDDGFMITSGSDVRSDGVNGDRDRWIYVLNFKRSNFEDQLQAGTWTLQFSGSNDGDGRTLHLTDDSKNLTTPIIQTQAGRRFDIVSGSNGNTSENGFGKRFGWFYPDMGFMVFGERLSNELYGDLTEPHIPTFNGSQARKSNYGFQPAGSGSNDADYKNAIKLVNCMKLVNEDHETSLISGSLSLYGEKEVTEVTFIVDIEGDYFNFTNNFSIITGSGRQMYHDDTGVLNGFPVASGQILPNCLSGSSMAFTGSAGEPSATVCGDEDIETISVMENNAPFIWPGVHSTTMHGDPKTFITGIELFDEHGECLAVARPSKPIKKGFDREVIIKVKLTF